MQKYNIFSNYYTKIQKKAKRLKINRFASRFVFPEGLEPSTR